MNKTMQALSYGLMLGAAVAAKGGFEPLPDDKYEPLNPSVLMEKVLAYDTKDTTEIEGGLSHAVTQFNLIDQIDPKGLPMNGGKLRPTEITYNDVGEEGPSVGDTVQYNIRGLSADGVEDNRTFREGLKADGSFSRESLVRVGNPETPDVEGTPSHWQNNNHPAFGEGMKFYQDAHRVLMNGIFGMEVEAQEMGMEEFLKNLLTE
tara:strand:+ start:1210 stop:1824 length:615 start_codon:yes stop_codon:yes gene_type:complete